MCLFGLVDELLVQVDLAYGDAEVLLPRVGYFARGEARLGHREGLLGHFVHAVGTLVVDHRLLRLIL